MKLKALSIALGTALFLPATGAMAAPSDGVTCPSDSRASFRNGVLKCIKTEVKTAFSICPGTHPIMKRTRLGRNQGLGNGVDGCQKVELPITGTRVGFGNDLVRTIPAGLGRWNRVIDGHPDTIGTDIFSRTERKAVRPRGAFYAHTNPRNGYRCPTGFTPRFSNGNLKCEQRVSRRSDCAFPFSLDVRSRADVCLLANRAHQTLPQGELTRNGWRLDINGSTGNRDRWLKTKFKYPSGR